MLDDHLGTFTHGHKSHGHSQHWPLSQGYHEGHHDKHWGAGMALGLLRKIAQNKILLAGLILSGLVVLALGIWILLTLFSLSGPILDFVGQNGVKGAVETLQALAQKLWAGTGK